MQLMPPKPPPAAMSTGDFRALTVGLKPKEVAERLGVHRATVYRWLNGTVNIDAASAALIRSVFKPKRK